ncbi:TraR/DksA family transcriptional regulator [Streptomyces bobili]|uniref:TraR/DksA family transcriptional regulator n=1 Tax=Streptomyces bobili TaxID=67280 RepID=UPI0036F7A1EF
MHHRTVVPPAPALSAQDLAVLREKLREQLQFRREQIQQLTDAAPARRDALRERRAPSQVEVGVQLAAAARMVLADVEAALRRMDEGHYGTCGLCGRPIARDLLEIVPQARHCARCRRVGATESPPG